jgi:hypothetical protein
VHADADDRGSGPVAGAKIRPIEVLTKGKNSGILCMYRGYIIDIFLIVAFIPSFVSGLFDTSFVAYAGSFARLSGTLREE